LGKEAGMSTVAGRVCVCVIGLAITSGGCASDYVPYVPIETRWVGGDPVFVKAPEVLTESHAIAFQIVLWGYREPYAVRDGKVYIQRSLQEDEDLLTNYTNKAERLSLEDVQRVLPRLR
jgi:hypothetical protein